MVCREPLGDTVPERVEGESSCPYVAGGATAQRLGRETRVQEAAL
jgi:hypothetical protein